MVIRMKKIDKLQWIYYMGLSRREKGKESKRKNGPKNRKLNVDKNKNQKKKKEMFSKELLKNWPLQKQWITPMKNPEKMV